MKMGIRTLKRTFASGIVYLLVISLFTTPLYPVMAFAAASPDTSGSLSQSHAPSIPTPPDIPAAQTSPVVFEGDPVYVANGSQLGRTFNMGNNSPTWENITPPTGGTIHYFTLDPRDAYGTAWLSNDEGIWRNTNLENLHPEEVRSAWTKVLPIGSLSVPYGCLANWVSKILPDPRQLNRTLAFVTVAGAEGYDCRTIQVTSVDNGNTWESRSLPECYKFFNSRINCTFPGTVGAAPDGTLYLLGVTQLKEKQ